MRFVAKHDFYSEEFRSAYATGMKYTVRPGNDKLAAAVAVWVADGKVDVLREEHAAYAREAEPARVAGVGTVSDAPTNTEQTAERPSLLRRLFSWL